MTAGSKVTAETKPCVVTQQADKGGKNRRCLCDGGCGETSLLLYAHMAESKFKLRGSQLIEELGTIKQTC